MTVKRVKEFSELHNYITKIPFIFESNIWEYDIKQANINVLRAQNKLSDEEYNELSIVPKQMREIVVGKKIQVNKSLQDDIYRGISIAKYKLILQNHINIDNIIRVANDSMYCNQDIPLKNQDININNFTIRFILKNHFTEFLNLNNIYLFIDLSKEEWNIDVKGIRESNLNLHQSFLGFICKLIYDNNVGGKDIALREFYEYYNSYINRSLDTSNYRELNADSSFRINMGSYSYLLSEYHDSPYKLDINYNLYLLRILYSYILMSK